MKRIVDYQMAQGIDLVAEVKRLMAEGYTPYGNPIFTGSCLAQAMVKYAEGDAV